MYLPDWNLVGYNPTTALKVMETSEFKFYSLLAQPRLLYSKFGVPLPTISEELKLLEYAVRTYPSMRLEADSERQSLYRRLVRENNWRCR